MRYSQRTIWYSRVAVARAGGGLQEARRVSAVVPGSTRECQGVPGRLAGGANLVGESLGYVGGTTAALHPLRAATVLVPGASADNDTTADKLSRGNVHLAVAELRVGGLRGAEAVLERSEGARTGACVHACNTAPSLTAHTCGGKEAIGKERRLAEARRLDGGKESAKTRRLDGGRRLAGVRKQAGQGG